MEEGDREDTCEATKVMYADANRNSNNIISEQDIKISFGLAEPDEKVSELPKATPHLPDNQHDISKQKEEDVSLDRMEAERQEWMKQVEQERSEWEALEDVQRTSTGSVKTSSLVAFAEAFEYFKSKTYDKRSINPVTDRTGLAALLHFLFGPPKLKQSLTDERDLVFCIAQVQLDDTEEIHGRILQTIYKKLTGSKFDCPRRGSHWETIGFQGNDPATDLRGVGFLGLMQILYAVTSSETSGLFTDFYRLSIDDGQNFPFCVMSFNVTRIAMQVLRQEKLHKECNKRKQVISVLNNFYMAVFLHIYTVWKTQFKTIKDSGHVMQDAERQATKDPAVLIRKLEVALKARKANKKKVPASAIPIAGPLMPDDPAGLHRKLSIASSLSSESGKKNVADLSLNDNTPNSTRFISSKKSSCDNLQDFTNIRVAMENEPVTNL